MNIWGEKILDLAANPYWVIGLFLSLTLILHGLFVFLFPLSLRAWKLADYIWLSLAFLSILGLVGQAQQFRAERVHNDVEWTTTQSLNDVRSWFTNYQILICAKAKTNKQNKTGRTDYSALCNLLEARINDITLLQKGGEAFPPLNHNLTHGLKDFSAIIPLNEQKILRNRLDRYAENRKRNIRNIQDLERNAIQRILLILAPVMFATALAIRITKVTAEYRLLPPHN
ncbi:hypothetical protein [Paremcibacter congregatus]|uniref:Uncharacterized protein n=1 Tax=Paremcibacter congregatus TaxID=2043170 RepID=A0A2G4YW64_9PROT|nr:hypothetical protein [Paremcibacter congregatus]PHZ86490.1 hypothetical protein CRD36_00965 [Paremcibacter congregatus]QDE28415.1 hypothetical protein FIV45_14635 [Paremcibacter congregatus]